MAEETKTYVFGNGDGSYGTVPAWLAAGNNGGLFGGNGFAGGAIGFILGLLFGNGWGGFGGFGGGNGAGAAAALGAQATANNNAEIVLRAIDGTDADVRQLSTMSGYSLDAIKSALGTVSTSLATLGGQLGMSSIQVVNAIQSGNASLASQLCQCCCDNKLLITSQGYENQIATLNQTNTLGSAISGSGQRTVDAIADLKTAMVKEFCDAKERDMQNEINTKNEVISTLRGQIDNANQTAQFAAMLAPINSKLAQIEGKQPNTVPVVWPNLTAVNNTPFYGGFNGYGYGFGGNSYWA